jgi:ferredoxin--NADP+ reductase
MSEHLCNATVVYRHDLNEYLSIVRVRPDSGAVASFKPGQFASLGVPRPDAAPSPDGRISKRNYIHRAYSIASSADERAYLEFLVVLVDQGQLTTRLWTLGEGDRLWMDAKLQGKFTLDPVPPDRNLVMLSTGTGIAPYVSMLRSFCRDRPWRQFILVNGVRYPDDLAYRQELESLAAEDATITYLPMVSREKKGQPWTGLRGRVQSLLEPGTFGQHAGIRLDPDRCHVFLCGNPDMIKSVQQVLEERGFTTHTTRKPGNLHFERYW